MHKQNYQLSTLSDQLDIHYIGMQDYDITWDLQKQYVRQIDEEKRHDTLLLLQHYPTYTIGTDRHPEHLLLNEVQLAEKGIKVYNIDRGGDITYHGPGQLVGYPLIFLHSVGLDLHLYLRTLEQVIIDWLFQYGVIGERKEGMTGVWVGDKKIAAIGVKFNKARQRKGFITSHGFALNIKAGLASEGFIDIIPCGIKQYGITSFNDETSMALTVEEAASQLMPIFRHRFGYSL